jgi:LysM repeat protein
MQCRRCLFSKIMAVLLTLLGVASVPLAGRAQTAPSVTEQDISGLIIATQEDRVSLSAGDTVILDQGRVRGVAVGDRYAIFQDSRTSVHPYTGRLIRMPREVIGEVAVVSVYEQTSSAQIVRSAREVNVGAPIAPLRLALARQQAPRPEDADVQAQARLVRVSPCVESTRQTVQMMENTGVKTPALADAKGALASAERAVEQANELLAAGEAERAAYRLDNALADCLRAAELLQRTGVVTAGRSPVVQPERYAVQRGDTLWGISAREQIYHDPFMWPLIYKANRQQIRDPDLVFPKQIFVIPRDYAPAEAAAAIQRAKQHGAWRLGDGR